MPVRVLSRHLRRLVGACLPLLVAGDALAQDGAPRTVPLQRIFSSDSLRIQNGAVVSPDGRWVVFGHASRGSAGASLWIARVGGTTATRLTSDGHADQQPAWFPSGDRIAFLSNRTSRDPSVRYVMSLAIDPATGAPVGSPRQVSVEGAVTLGAVSPDGAWISYSAADQRAVRIVPAAGGPAREVAAVTGPRAVIPAGWSRDGRSLHYVDASRRVANTGTLHVVGVDGGAPRAIASGDSTLPFAQIGADAVLHVRSRAATDPRRGAALRVTDAAGAVVASLDLPPDRSIHPLGLAQGRSVTVVSREQTQRLRERRLDGSAGGAPVELGDFWPVGIDPDGNMVGTAGEAGTRRVEVRDLAGRVLRAFPVPADARNPSLAGHLLSYRRGVAARAASALHAVDTRTGRSAPLSARSLAGYLDSPRGMFPSGRRGTITLVEPEGTSAVVSVVTGLGERRVAARLANLPGLRAVAVADDRLAWAVVERDTVAVMYRPDAGSAPVALARFPGDRFTEFSFSPDARRLAILNGAQDVRVVDVAGQPGPARPLAMVQGTDCWDLRWASDAALLLTCDGHGGPAGGTRTDVYLRPLDAARAAEPLTADARELVDDYFMSPDGRRLYQVTIVPAGSAIWTADLRVAESGATGRGR